MAFGLSRIFVFMFFVNREEQLRSDVVAGQVSGVKVIKITGRTEVDFRVNWN